MTALRHVQAQRPGSGISVVETVELTAIGAPLGLKCPILMYPGLGEQVDVARMLERLRDVLLATEADEDGELMRAVVLRGERRSVIIEPATLQVAQRFMARAKAGLGGFSEDRRKLALSIEGRAGIETVLFALWLPLRTAQPVLSQLRRDPMLLITSLDGASIDPELGWVASLR